MTITDTDIQGLVGAQYTALADTLADQPPAIADAPSLCPGWAVRHVVAHLTMAVRYDQTAFLHQLAAAGHNFSVLSDTIALRDGAHRFPSLLDDLRSETMASWAPPGGGSIGAVSHIVIHGLDITSGLDLPRSASDDATRIVLDALAGGLAANFGIDPTATTLRTTDLDWETGSGSALEATAADLVLALAGRPRPAVDLPHTSPGNT